MTTKEAGERLGVSDSRIRQHIRDGRLKVEKKGPMSFISEEEIERFERELAEGAAHRPGPNARAVQRQQKPTDEEQR